MTCNLGTKDRTARALAGIALIVAGGGIHMALPIVGGVLLLTAAIRFCPLYLPLGLNTSAQCPG